MCNHSNVKLSHILVHKGIHTAHKSTFFVRRMGDSSVLSKCITCPCIRSTSEGLNHQGYYRQAWDQRGLQIIHYSSEYSNIYIKQTNKQFWKQGTSFSPQEVSKRLPPVMTLTFRGYRVIRPRLVNNCLADLSSLGSNPTASPHIFPCCWGTRSSLGCSSPPRSLQTGQGACQPS